MWIYLETVMAVDQVEVINVDSDSILPSFYKMGTLEYRHIHGKNR